MGAVSFWVIGTFLFYCLAFAHISLSQVSAYCCRWDCVPFAEFALASSLRSRTLFLGSVSLGVSGSHAFRWVRPARVAEGSRVFNGICPSVVTENSHVFQGICPVGVIRLLRDLPYCGNRFIEKQKSRHFCNFFAIADSFLFLQSGNRLPNGRLPAFLHRDPRSGEPITIRNRKKVAIRAEFLFLVSLRWLILGRHRGRATKARHRETSGRGDPSAAPRDGPDAVAQARHREMIRARSVPALRDESEVVLRDSLGAALGRHWGYGRGGSGTARGIPSDALRHSGVVCMTTLRANVECRTEATENPHRVCVRD